MILSNIKKAKMDIAGLILNVLLSYPSDDNISGIITYLPVLEDDYVWTREQLNRLDSFLQSPSVSVDNRILLLDEVKRCRKNMQFKGNTKYSTSLSMYYCAFTNNNYYNEDNMKECTIFSSFFKQDSVVKVRMLHVLQVLQTRKPFYLFPQ